MTRLLSRPARDKLIAVVMLLLLLVLVTINAPALGLFGSEPITLFPAQGSPSSGPPKVVAVFFSGDMGFKFGMGAHIAAAVADRGIPVIGISSPVAFARHHTRAETDAVVTGAIRFALARTGAEKVLLMAQSYGADILATTAPDLPADLRARTLAIDLTVPARDVYFRADPSTLAYLGTPDAHPAMGMRALRWAPVICVYGRDEADSLCPALKGTAARVIGLPGTHHLNHDRALVIATTLAALRIAAPEAGI